MASKQRKGHRDRNGQPGKMLDVQSWGTKEWEGFIERTGVLKGRVTNTDPASFAAFKLGPGPPSRFCTPSGYYSKSVASSKDASRAHEANSRSTAGGVNAKIVGPGEVGAGASYEQNNGWSESSNRADVAADVASSERYVVADLSFNYHSLGVSKTCEDWLLSEGASTEKSLSKFDKVFGRLIFQRVSVGTSFTRDSDQHGQSKSHLRQDDRSFKVAGNLNASAPGMGSIGMGASYGVNQSGEKAMQESHSNRVSNHTHRGGNAGHRRATEPLTSAVNQTERDIEVLWESASEDIDVLQLVLDISQRRWNDGKKHQQVASIVEKMMAFRQALNSSQAQFEFTLELKYNKDGKNGKKGWQLKAHTGDQIVGIKRLVVDERSSHKHGWQEIRCIDTEPPFHLTTPIAKTPLLGKRPDVRVRLRLAIPWFVDSNSTHPGAPWAKAAVLDSGGIAITLLLEDADKSSTLRHTFHVSIFRDYSEYQAPTIQNPLEFTGGFAKTEVGIQTDNLSPGAETGEDETELGEGHEQSMGLITPPPPTSTPGPDKTPGGQRKPGTQHSTWPAMEQMPSFGQAYDSMTETWYKDVREPSQYHDVRQVSQYPQNIPSYQDGDSSFIPEPSRYASFEGGEVVDEQHIDQKGPQLPQGNQEVYHPTGESPAYGADDPQESISTEPELDWYNDGSQGAPRVNIRRRAAPISPENDIQDPMPVAMGPSHDDFVAYADEKMQGMTVGVQTQATEKRTKGGPHKEKKGRRRHGHK